MIDDSVRSDAGRIFNAAVEAVEPGELTRNRFKQLAARIPEFTQRPVNILSAGKAAVSMAESLLHSGQVQVAEAVAVTAPAYVNSHRVAGLDIIEGSHPLTDSASFQAGRRVTEILTEWSRQKIPVLFLVSGGASAMLEVPVEDLKEERYQEIVTRLLQSEADIHEINTVRKALSELKNGGILSYLKNNLTASLIISDVPGDDLTTVASGLTVPSEISTGSVTDVLNKYRINEVEKITGLLKPETIKSGLNHCNLLAGSNLNALKAATLKATELGYSVLNLGSQISGDTAEAARFHSEIALDIAAGRLEYRLPAVIISAGECSVDFSGLSAGEKPGRGGRNQHFALCAGPYLNAEYSITVLAAGTDGIDGDTNAAGAFMNYKAYRSVQNPRHYISKCSSYDFHKKAGTLFQTGTTGTNVSDLRLFLIT